jgi:hypothetical protein
MSNLIASRARVEMIALFSLGQQPHFALSRAREERKDLLQPEIRKRFRKNMQSCSGLLHRGSPMCTWCIPLTEADKASSN